MATDRKDDAATLAAIGVLAATLAAVAHEALGHGGACLAVGGRITLITSIVFRCLDGGPTTDLAGPLGSLAAGLVAVGAFRLGLAGRAPAGRLFLTVTGAVALFWFFGQLGQSAALGKGDWAFAAQGYGWPAAWRWVALAVAVAGYLGTVRFVVRASRPLAAEAPAGGASRRLLIPYAAAALSAAVAGALWRGDPWGSALEGLTSVGIASLGYAWAARRAAEDLTPDAPAPLVRGWPWIAVGLAVYAVFLLTLGRGMGRLA